MRYIIWNITKNDSTDFEANTIKECKEIICNELHQYGIFAICDSINGEIIETIVFTD